MKSTRKRSRLKRWFIALVLVPLGLVWFGIASRDQDWLWFLSVFNEQAARIHLYRAGEKLVLQPGDGGFEELNEAVNQTLRHIRAQDSLAILVETQQEYYDQFSAVEVFYTEPVIIHTSHAFAKADKYLFPQSGYHFDPPVVFAGMQDRPDYRRGVLVLTGRDRLDEAVNAVWAAHERE